MVATVRDNRPDGFRKQAAPTILRVFFVLGVVALALVILEVGLRFVGLGRPILYYNAAWGGVRPLPDQQVERFGARVTVDSAGFRSARPMEPDALRLLFLGDSVTWGGTSISDEETFAEVAADRVRASGKSVYAMNAGVNGTALVNHAEIFHDTPEIDAVVWLFPWGDVTRGYASAGHLWPARYRPRLAMVELGDFLLLSYWTKSFRQTGPPSPRFRAAPPPAGYESFMERDLQARQERNLTALRTVVARARALGLAAVVGVTPYRRGSSLAPPTDVQRRVLNALRSQGATVFDVAAVLANEDLSAVYLDEVHFSVRGHRAVGDALGDLLIQALERGTAGRPNALTPPEDRPTLRP